ncbi:putative oxidoreductase YcjS [Pelagimonas phthalicica]|uniref:Putative oxidoreductase YcjS n=1 Tax=Pelagimonas phthalicica TaxID=1037362 RepID=A0A238JB60_9RHOB|nr:Gfo/Idh/MocA family oxidoreductase [Pelagimonas phthalicica]TDS94087.1 putative dehydrogenase [Pelagimonas phthalicica]SMX27387.1 putative oxidoreductase YcjS [Pelagimonas phthalicica]
MLRVAIVGAGIGAQHLAGFLDLPEVFEVACLCDLDTARAAAVVGQTGVAVTAELEAVLADASIDIIDVCLPPHLHFDVAKRALLAGKHVICEKPLVASLREADGLLETVQRTGKSLFPVFQYRYGIGTAQLMTLQEAGLAGKLFAGSIETHWNRDAAYYDVDWRGTWAGERGGCVLGHAIHIHDFLPAFLSPVAQVFADLATRVNEIEVEDCAALSIRLESGALITSSVTLGCASDYSHMRLMFEGFTVESGTSPYAPAADPWVFTAREPTKQAEIDAVLAGIGPVKTGYAGLFDALAKALEGQGGREVTGLDGRRSLEFVTAVYDSARRNVPVRLPLGADHPLYDGWLPA